MSDWGSGPASPVSGTVITKAFWDANARDLLNVLRALTGGDPAASNRLLVSDSDSAASWQALSTGLIPDGIVTDAKLATPKVTKAGDTMTGTLTFSGDLVGLLFSSGGRIRDQASPQRTLMTAAGDRFTVFDEGGSNAVFDANYADSAPTFKGTALSLSGHTHSYLPLAGGIMTDDIQFSNDLTGLLLASGGRLRDQASPGRTVLNAAQDRFDVYDEGGSTQLLQLDSSTFTYKSTAVSLSGHTHSYLPLAGGTLSGGVTFSDDTEGVTFSSGGRIVDTASPQRTLFSVAGDRLDVYNESLGTIMLQLIETSSVFKAFGNTVWHAGNLPASTTPTADTAPIADGAGHLALGWLSGITNSQLASGAAVANLGYTPTRGAVGGYTGNASTMTETGIPFQPDVVIFMQTNGSVIGIGLPGNVGWVNSSGYGSDDLTMTSDGFTLTGNHALNVSSAAYFYVAFKAS